MKRLLILALAIIFCIFAFVACDKKDSDDEASSGTESESTQENGDESSSESGGSEDNVDQENCEHVEEIVKGIEPTCTENGLTDGKKCSLCGKELVAQQTIITQGHVATEIKGIPATCSEAGLTNGMKCLVCDEILQEQKVIEALPHEYDYYGACHGCSKKIGEAVLVVLDISSSMKELMGEGSRFTVSRDVILEFISDFREYDYFGLILFDAETHVAMDLAKIEDKEKFISELEYNLNHMYYCYYIDQNGKETEIVVNEADGDKYTSLGYTYPVEYKSNNFDRINGNAIRTYGTAYMGAIQTAGQMFDNFKHEAISKKLVFVSDGEPMDKGASYDAILERLASRDIVTTTVGLGVNGTGAENELRLMASAGNGVYRPSNDNATLYTQLILTYRKADFDGKISKKGAFTFLEYGEKTYLVEYAGNDKVLELPSEYKGKSYKIMEYAIANNEHVQSIIVPEGITLPKNSITNCPNLFSITVKEGGVFENQAVSNCIRLTYIFDENLALTSQTGYSQTIYLGEMTTSRSSVRIHPENENQWLEITDDGFVLDVFQGGRKAYLVGYVGNSKDVVIPSKLPNDTELLSIWTYAFAQTDINSIIITSSGNYSLNIAQNAFYGCESLKSVTFAGEISVEASAFFGCTSLEEIVFSEGVTDVTIGNGAFNGCTNLKNISIPDGVETVSIGASAFKGCTSLETLSFPSSVTDVTIGNNAFEGCTMIKNISIPEGVETVSIRASAFKGCTSLETLSFPSSVTDVTIGSGAFEGCTNLASLKIPSNVSSIKIGAFAFFDCTLIKSVEFTGNQIIDINANAFSLDTSVTCGENNRYFIRYYVGGETLCGNSSHDHFGTIYANKGESITLSTSTCATIPSGDSFFGWISQSGEVYAPGATIEPTENLVLYPAIGREIGTASDLSSYLNSSGSFKYVRLTADITLTQNIAAYWSGGFYATIDLNGHTINSSGVQYGFGQRATGMRFVGKGTINFTSSSALNGAFYETSIHGYWESKSVVSQQLLIGKNVKVVSNVPLVRITNSMASLPNRLPIDIYGEVVAPALTWTNGGDHIEINLHKSCKIDLSSGTLAPVRDTSTLEGTMAVLTIFGGEIKLPTDFEGFHAENENRIKVIIRGGSFTQDVSSYLGNGYKVEYNNGLYTVVVK